MSGSGVAEAGEHEVAGAGERPMRADARRNRQRVLDAAAAVFAERGLGAQMDDVAQRAGVGVGTVYRRFPTKEALVEAIVADRVEDLLAQARAALAEPDAGRGFAEFFGAVVAGMASFKAMSDVMARGLGAPPRGIGAVRRGLVEAGEELLRRAQEAGAIRADVGLSDIALLLGGIADVLDRLGAAGGRAQERLTGIVLDGLAAGAAARTLPGEPISPAEMAAGATHGGWRWRAAGGAAAGTEAGPCGPAAAGPGDEDDDLRV